MIMYKCTAIVENPSPKLQMLKTAVEINRDYEKNHSPFFIGNRSSHEILQDEYTKEIVIFAKIDI